MEYKISVVIPAYNSASTLPETLDCLLGQSLHTGVQIIPVNDGSKDSTPDVIKAYAEKYADIHPVYKENGGVSSARNEGIKAAKGKYILFLDADDLLEKDSLRCLYESMEKENADAAIFRIMRFGFGGNEFNPIVDELAAEKVIDPYDKRLMWNYLVGNKCYKTELLQSNNLLFPSTRYSEDGAFWMSFIMKTQPKIIGVYGAVSKYRRSDPAIYRSVTQTVRIDLIDDFVKSTDMITKAVELSFRNPDCKCKNRNDYRNELLCKNCHTILNEFYRQLWSADEETLKYIGELFSERYSRLSPEYRRKLKSLDPDIFEPVFTHGECAEKPFIRVKCKTPSEEFLHSLYLQTMPRFILACDNAGKYTDFGNVCKSSERKDVFTVCFKGKKAMGPGVLRLILLLHRKYKFVPAFILKHAVFLGLKIKDNKNK